MRFIDRYKQGEFVPVWEDLRALGPRLYEREFQEEAEAVAAETMARVQVNAALLVAHLAEIGYRFSQPLRAKAENVDTVKFGVVEVCDQVLAPPSPFLTVQLPLAEGAFGVLPCSIRSFYQAIGGLDLTGSYPGISTMADEENSNVQSPVLSEPIQIFPLGISLHIRGTMPQWVRKLPGNHRLFPIALEKYQRHGFSGGPFEGLILDGQPAADASFTGDGLPFVESLRLAFEWCGFPGFRHTPDSFPPELQCVREKLVDF